MRKPGLARIDRWSPSFNLENATSRGWAIDLNATMSSKFVPDFQVGNLAENPKRGKERSDTETHGAKRRANYIITSELGASHHNSLSGSQSSFVRRSHVARINHSFYRWSQVDRNRDAKSKKLRLRAPAEKRDAHVIDRFSAAIFRDINRDNDASPLARSAR